MIDQDLVRKTKIDIFKAILSLDPKAPVFAELGEDLLSEGRTEEAIGVLGRGLSWHPENLTALATLVKALTAAGRHAEARQTLDQARRQLDRAAEAIGRLPEPPEPVIEPEAAPAPPAPEPVQAEAAAPEAGPDKEALAIELAASPAEPEPGPDWDQAEEDLPEEDFGQLASPTLGELYLKQGHHQAAAEVYRRILAKDPGNKAVQAKLRALSAWPAEDGKSRLLGVLLKWQLAARGRLVQTRALAS